MNLTMHSRCAAMGCICRMIGQRWWLLLVLLLAGSVPATQCFIEFTAPSETSKASYLNHHIVMEGSGILHPEAIKEEGDIDAERPRTHLLPLQVRMHRHAGLYQDKAHAPELKNILLLTASNFGYLEMLTNWECFAKRLGLDWMVMAMDQDLEAHLGERAFLATGPEQKEAASFRRAGFNVVGCNKLRSVLDLLRQTNLDIVFSDADNVFKSDPFLSTLTLGSMMRSGRYEYVYGRDIGRGAAQGGQIQNLDPKIYHREPGMGNTGFYYVAGGRKQSIVQTIFEASVEWCDRRPTFDDQDNFWGSLVAMRKKNNTEEGYIACFRHCDRRSCTGVDESMVFNYCDMSPWEYILGSFTPESALREARMVSYHATHVIGWPKKKYKLKNVGLWANCNESDIADRQPLLL